MADEPEDSAIFDLSALAHNLQKQAEGSSEREAFIEKLRKKVQSGEYNVDAEALAKKLLEDAIERGDPNHCADEGK